MSLLYSVGHGTLAEEAFLSQLSRFGVQCLADVRRYPKSRRNPHFAKDALARSCARAGIRYVHLGESLGGFRDAGYEEHARTAEFRAGLEALESLAGEHPTAFVCAEKLPFKCHRRIIAEALEGRGHTVKHIVDGQLLL